MSDWVSELDDLIARQPKPVAAAIEWLIAEAGTSDADWNVLLEAGKRIQSQQEEIAGLKVKVAFQAKVNEESGNLIESYREEIDRLREDARRYQFIRDNYRWERRGEDLTDDEAVGMIVVYVPYLANLSCAAAVDSTIDRLLSTQTEKGQ